MVMNWRVLDLGSLLGHTRQGRMVHRPSLFADFLLLASSSYLDFKIKVDRCVVLFTHTAIRYIIAAYSLSYY